MTDVISSEAERPESRYSRRGALILLAILSAVYLISIFFRPADGDYFTVCGFKNFTGLPCPACGLTHSFCSIGKGEIVRAFSYNIIGPPLFLFSILFWLRSLSVLSGWSKHVARFDDLVIRVKPAQRFLLAFAIFGAARIVVLMMFSDSVRERAPMAKLLAWLTG